MRKRLSLVGGLLCVTIVHTTKLYTRVHLDVTRYPTSIGVQLCARVRWYAVVHSCILIVSGFTLFMQRWLGIGRIKLRVPSRVHW